jgi:hypothetical protein
MERVILAPGELTLDLSTMDPPPHKNKPASRQNTNGGCWRRNHWICNIICQQKTPKTCNRGSLKRIENECMSPCLGYRNSGGYNGEMKVIGVVCRCSVSEQGDLHFWCLELVMIIIKITQKSILSGTTPALSSSVVPSNRGERFHCTTPRIRQTSKHTNNGRIIHFVISYAYKVNKKTPKHAILFKNYTLERRYT